MIQSLTQATGSNYGFGLYIHWPYCAKICPYCDFNVYAAKDRDPEPLLVAMINDIKAHRERLPGHPALDSIFFGGGTPSLLSPSALQRLIEAADTTFGLASGVEISLEANPNDVLRAAPSDWRRAGVNRVSLGVQSLDDQALNFLGRDHDSEAGRMAFERAAQHFNNISIDLIYALPGQSLENWDGQLTAALGLGAPHLSLYELTIEPPTPFGKQVERGQWTPLPDDRQADLYELTQSLCETAGLPAYEVSNHAQASDFESVHNRIYWRSGDWIGVGPGAHGRLSEHGRRVATEAVRRPKDYADSTETIETDLPPLDIARELVAMSLRYRDGLDLNRLERLGFERPEQSQLVPLTEAGLVQVAQNKIALTASGRLLADYIAAQISP
ncbi:MAG: radical SAM family heme chaperone HemW [Pseudomonadota bacterium]